MSHPAAALHNQASTHNSCQSLITPRVTTTSTHVGRWSSGGAALAGAPQAGQIWLVLLGEGGCTSTASPVPWMASVGAEQYHYWKGCSLAVCGEVSGSSGGSCMQRWQWLTVGVWGETPTVSWALASKHPIWPRRRWGSIAGDVYSSRARLREILSKKEESTSATGGGEEESPPFIFLVETSVPARGGRWGEVGRGLEVGAAAGTVEGGEVR
ncbi:hypothetical protein PVAP13_3KG248500 [Panicum virgatum]|uniref:Uncharacterized protein n=1 Tax=Panicum virgatum TaxID=38727 RepID=A0A8T0V4Y6_PANVG|nr:hypothetical protein PVAP13_3KG248500 [Panicum virgatum]